MDRTGRLSRRDLSKLALGAAALPAAADAAEAPGAPSTSRAGRAGAGARGRWTPVLPGVWRMTLGAPEAATPVRRRFRAPAAAALGKLPAVAAPPLAAAGVRGARSGRGYELSLDLDAGELVYGLGLQLHSFVQRGTKKTLRVNADPKSDSGDSHAPVPFYVTTKGYGILVDTARYATFYVGRGRRGGRAAARAAEKPPAEVANKDLLPPAYFRKRFGEPSEVVVDVPHADGIDVYLFAGPGMREALARYNLFSGGGSLPPRWGLGFWYHCHSQFTQDEVVARAKELHDAKIPCDVIGLEPGWMTHGYSCSFVWSKKFPEPERMRDELSKMGVYVNAWEHAFTHPSSPIHAALAPHSGDFEVWDGLVPDFYVPEARRIYNDFHDREHAARGIAGYKLDECDNSDFTGGWSFPECSRFPSGVDGEQMHSLFGIAYQETIDSMFRKRNVRSLQLVRSSHALASPYPFVLYSDLYDHKEFIRGLTTAAFSGLLWCPEVREAADGEDLIRRLQVTCLSPIAFVNAWYIRNAPWKQVKIKENNAGQFEPGWEKLQEACRRIVELRMRLVPYLYTAFVRYKLEGISPFRALVIDDASDPKLWTLEDEYMIGDDLLVAAVTAGTKRRDVYLPKGRWHDFWTGAAMEGGKTMSVDVPLDRQPIYVRSGALLPLADVTLSAADPKSRRVTVEVFGAGDRPFVLYEDRDETLDFERGKYNTLTLAWDAARGAGRADRAGAHDVPRWEIAGWRRRG